MPSPATFSWWLPSSSRSLKGSPTFYHISLFNVFPIHSHCHVLVWTLITAYLPVRDKFIYWTVFLLLVHTPVTLHVATSMIFPKWKFKHVILKYFSESPIEAFHFPWYVFWHFTPLALTFPSSLFSFHYPICVQPGPSTCLLNLPLTHSVPFYLECLLPHPSFSPAQISTFWKVFP